MIIEPVTTLRTVLGTYPHTEPLKQRTIQSDRFTLDFTEIKPISKAFKPMVRTLDYDVCEMAIVTFLQAKAFNKPLLLLPATMLGRFQHGCMLYNAERGLLTPDRLAGRRIGVRAYTQTTGAWVRGILADDYGVDANRMRWITFEDAHVAEYRDPPTTERAPADKDITAMLLTGEIDAAIYGADIPKDPRLKSVIPDPDSAARAWYQRHGIVPVNHLVVIKEALVRANPALAGELYQLLLRAKAATTRPDGGGIDFIPFGIEANRGAIERMIKYCVAQQLIPRALTIDEIFDDSIRKITP